MKWEALGVGTSTLSWWKSICEQRLEQQQRLSSQFLTGIAPQLDDVYIPLGLVERKQQSRKNNKDELDSTQGSALYQETEITRRFSNAKFFKQVLRRGDRQWQKLVILGEPGTGKTTLLQQAAKLVAAEIEEAVAVWVPLAALQGRSLEDYLLEVWLRDTVQMAGKASVTETDKNDFVGQFHQGRVWLFLDGADEMVANGKNPLLEIAPQIRGFLREARILLTCRLNLWDGSANLGDEFDVYRTLDFNYPTQIEQFIDRWFATLKSQDAITRGQQLCTALKEPGKERIWDLVKNPLRLTLLCFTWHKWQGELPDTKAVLYQNFFERFYEWNKHPFPLTSEEQERWNQQLGELAREAIDKEPTRFRLRHKFVCQFLGSPKDKGSLFDLALEVGWLNRIGVDVEDPDEPVYAFYHASFQEYFAARAVDDWHYFLNHVPYNPQQGTYRIFEPQWKEVIKLWLGREDVPKEQKEQFIKALVEFEDGCENVYRYRAYFLAAVGIAEFKNCSWASEIVGQIVKWVCGYFNPEEKLINQEAIATLLETDRSSSATN